MYLLGIEFLKESNESEGISLLQKASDLDNDKAQIQLANFYKHGYYVKKDINKCIELLNKAKENGNSKALIQLSYIYTDGIDIEKDLEKAFEYDKEAASKGYAQGYINMYNKYYNGWGIEQDFSKALSYLQNAVTADVPEAYKIMAEFVEKGAEELGIEKNDTRALFLYERGAKLGDPICLKKTSYYYNKGIGTQQDFKKAFEYALEGVQKNNGVCQFYVAQHYQQGTGIEQSDSEAFKWYKSAGDNEKILSALEEIGKCYYFGLGTEQNFSLAVKYFTDTINYAKKADMLIYYAESFYLLGTCYEHGFGVEKDIVEAKKLFTQAREFGNVYATQALERLK